MMKKNFFYLPLVLLAVLSTMSLASCSSDDDDDVVTAGAVPSPTLTDADGNKLRLTSIGNNIWFKYDEAGKLTSCYGDGVIYKIEGDTFTFETEEGTCNIATNAQGLISRISVKLDVKAEDGSYAKGAISLDVRYNSERQLVSISGYNNYEEYVKTRDRRSSETANGTYTYTWSDGNLVESAMNSTYKDSENGEEYSGKESYSVAFRYGNQPNVFKQFPYYMADATMGDILNFLFAVGLYGVGPVNLPTGYTKIESGDDYETEKSDCSLTFTLNDNGSIRSEQKNGYSALSYQYETVTRAVAPQAVVAKSLLSAFKEGRLFKNAKRK